MAELEITNIKRRFESFTALDNVSLSVDDGEFMTLLGPSGCGKSTLLRIIAGLDSQDEGQIRIGDRHVDHLRPKNRNVAMVFQSYALYPYMTVRQNISLPLVMQNLSRRQRLPGARFISAEAKDKRARIDDRVNRVTAALGIEHLAARKPGQLSGGQRQRVALGRAMVREPAVFLMDEPLSNLDAKLRVQMRAEIADLHSRLKTTFVYVTHDQAEAMTMSDRIAVMMNGSVLQVGRPTDVYDDPADLQVASFIGSPQINTLGGRLSAPSQVNVGGMELTLRGEVDAPPGTTVTVGFRPEATEVAAGDTGNTLEGAVKLIEHLGADLYVHVAIADERPVIARVQPRELSNLRTGDQIRLAVPPTALLLFDEHGQRLRPHVQVTSTKRSSA